MTELRIGLLAQETGTSTATIRYYEDINLLPPAPRQEGGQRRYRQEDVQRLLLIRRCRDFGFSIEQVRELMAIYEDPNSCCDGAADIAESHLTSIREKILELKTLEENIVELLAKCENTCAGGNGPNCKVFDVGS